MLYNNNVQGDGSEQDWCGDRRIVLSQQYEILCMGSTVSRIDEILPAISAMTTVEVQQDLYTFVLVQIPRLCTSRSYVSTPYSFCQTRSESLYADLHKLRDSNVYRHSTKYFPVERITCDLIFDGFSRC